jgi:predicted glutamine amidotransferase
MCRLGFLSYKKDEDATELVKLATTYYGYANNDGMGFAYIDPKGTTYLMKTPEEAIQFWLKPENRGLKIETKACIMHTRLASSGKVEMNNTHPFYDEKSGISFCHNGTLTNFRKLKEHLEEKGYIFQGDTDSEVMAKAYAEYGKDFTKKMKEFDVTGQATILALHPDGTIAAYTNNGSLEMWKTEKGVVAFSDKQFFNEGENLDVDDDTLYTIKNGEIVSKEKIEPIKTWSGTYVGNYGLGYDYSVGRGVRVAGGTLYGNPDAYDWGEEKPRGTTTIIPGQKERWHEEKEWNPRKRKWRQIWKRQKWDEGKKEWVTMFTQKFKPNFTKLVGDAITANAEGVWWLGLKGWKDDLTAMEYGKKDDSHKIERNTIKQVIKKIRELGTPDFIETNLRAENPITELEKAEVRRLVAISEQIGYDRVKVDGWWVLARPKPQVAGTDVPMEGQEPTQATEKPLTQWKRQSVWNEISHTWDKNMWVKTQWNPRTFEWERILVQKHKPTKKQEDEEEEAKAFEKLWIDEKEAEKQAEREASGEMVFEDEDEELFRKNPAAWAEKRQSRGY